MTKIAMTFEEFYNLTPGERIARRGTIAVRPFHPDWANAQMTAIADFAVYNPWMRHTLGHDIEVSVQASKDGQTVMFIFSRDPA